MLVNFIFLILTVCPTVWSQRSCSRDRMRQCQDALLRNIQRRVNDMNRQEMSSHCVNVREDFNCLLRETRCVSSETERNRNGDTLRNTLKYIRDGCDSQGASWRDSNCYVGEAMKTCESSYPLGGSQYASHNPEACRKFNLFQECVMEAVRSRCRSDDEKLLGQYLVDSAQDLAWNCGEATSSVSDWDRNRDDRYDRYDRDRGDRDRNDRDRDRDRDRDSYRNGGSRDRDRDRDYSRDSDRDRYSDRYDRNNGGYDRGYGNSNSDISCCRSERCDRNRLQECRDALLRIIDSRSSGYQDSQKCRKTRDDFNCLLWHTSNCQSRGERDRDNDVFRRARDFISRNCDNYGRWSENSCFKSPEMQRCENSLTNNRGGANYDTCRSYLSFRDCMQDELQRRCTRDDELYQGAYLTDKAQELSWQCGNDQNNGRNQYSTYDNNRRDSYDSAYGSYNSPPHLEDDDAMCLSRAQTYTDQCKSTLDDRRRSIYTEDDYDARDRISCCSARQYRTCLYDSTRKVCQSDRTRVVDSLLGRYKYELDSDKCRRLYDADCNSANAQYISFLLTFCATILLFFIHHVK